MGVNFLCNMPLWVIWEGDKKTQTEPSCPIELRYAPDYSSSDSSLKPNEFHSSPCQKG